MGLIKDLRARIRELSRLRRRSKPQSAERRDYKQRQRAHERQLDRALERRKEREHERKPNFNGHPDNVTDAVKREILRANRFGLYVTSTTGGSHTSTSYHYQRRAFDCAGSYEKMVAYQRDCARRRSEFAEVFGPDNNACVKNGVLITLGEGTFLENQHDNHVHVAI